MLVSKMLVYVSRPISARVLLRDKSAKLWEKAAATTDSAL